MRSLVLGLFWLLCVVARAEDKDIVEVDPELDDDVEVLPILSYFSYDNDQFAMSMTKLNWFEAQQYCLSKDYLLANIETDVKQDEVLLFMQSDDSALPFLANEIIWTSGTNLGLSNQYVWHSSGERLSYRNFLINPSGSSRCIGINAYTGDWSSVDCRDRHYFVCQKLVENAKCGTEDIQKIRNQ